MRKSAFESRGRPDPARKTVSSGKKEGKKSQPPNVPAGESRGVNSEGTRMAKQMRELTILGGSARTKPRREPRSAARPDTSNPQTDEWWGRDQIILEL